MVIALKLCVTSLHKNIFGCRFNIILIYGGYEVATRWIARWPQYDCCGAIRFQDTLIVK